MACGRGLPSRGGLQGRVASGGVRASDGDQATWRSTGAGPKQEDGGAKHLSLYTYIGTWDTDKARGSEAV